MSQPQVSSRYALFVDGSPGPKVKPGWSGWGVALMAGESPIYESCGVTFGRVSTNAVELEALIQGLSYLLKLQLPTMVTVWTDSKYVMGCVAKIASLHEAGFVDAKGNPIENQDRIRFLYEILYEMDMLRKAFIRWTKGHQKKDGVLKVGNDLADTLSKLAAYKGEVFYRENRTINDSTQ